MVGHENKTVGRVEDGRLKRSRKRQDLSCVESESREEGCISQKGIHLSDTNKVNPTQSPTDQKG